MPVYEVKIIVTQRISAESLETAEKLAFDELLPFNTEYVSTLKIDVLDSSSGPPDPEA
jgi:hypothetical protein